MNYLLFKMVANELSKATSFPVSEIYSKLEQPPSPEMGDVAFPCFSLAKTLKKAPHVIAEDMLNRICFRSHSQATAVFSKVKVSGGYLNFYLNKTEVLKLFFEKAKNRALVNFPTGKAKRGKRVTIEHTSVNPNASPHIGRARNAMIGDAIVRLLKYLQYDVYVRYFVNDVGKQMALLVHCVKNIPEINFSELLQLYVDANEKMKNNSELEEEVFHLLNRMENGDADVFSEFARVVDICVQGKMKIFNEFGIFYDQYDYESKYVRSRQVEKILAALKETGRLFEDEKGRLVLNLEEFGLNPEHPYLPLTRKDKTSLYPLRDICYNVDKAKEHPDRNIVVLGEDQRLYGKQINAALNLLGIEGPELVNYSFVLLPEGKMSTRAGQVVLLEDVMRDTARLAPKPLAYGAIKYSILKCSNEKNVVFDREAALNFHGDTGVYIQYSYARIQSLLSSECLDTCIDDVITLVHPLEWEIIKKLLAFSQVLSAASQDFNFSGLCSYLFELCQYFSRWYSECPIKNSDGHQKKARLFLASVTGNIIKDGLNILGIDAPERI